MIIKASIQYGAPLVQPAGALQGTPLPFFFHYISLDGNHSYYIYFIISRLGLGFRVRLLHQIFPALVEVSSGAPGWGLALPSQPAQLRALIFIINHCY